MTYNRSVMDESSKRVRSEGVEGSKEARPDGSKEDPSDGAKPELVSEPIKPVAGSFDTSRMGRGEPGLPSGFTWRGQSYEIAQELSAWKESSREGARAQGDLYLRRHCFKLRMSDGAIWSIYFERQSPRSGNPKQRWFLYTLECG